jgi:hypothetical protein
VVRADQATHDTPTLDPGSDVDGVAGLAQRRFLLPPLVRPVAVIVPCVLGQHYPQVPLAEDQHVIQALTVQRARSTSQPNPRTMNR